MTYVVPVFAIGVPVLYVLGRIYKETYWDTLQIPYSLMDYPIEDYLYWGFVAISNELFRLVNRMPLGPLGTWLLTILALALSLALMVSLRRWLGSVLLSFDRWLRPQVTEWKNNKDKWHVQVALPLLVIGQWINGIFLSALLVVLVLALSIAGASAAGRHAADEARKRIRHSYNVTMGDARPIAHLKGEPSTQSGALLECAASWCVLSRRGEFVAVRVDDISRVDHCPATRVLGNGAIACDGDSTVSP